MASMVSSVGAYGSVCRRGLKKNAIRKLVHGLTTVHWDYIIDEWKYPERHLSLQIRLPSGINVHSQLIHRVSTNQDEYVLSFLYSTNFQIADKAFFSYIGKENESLDDQSVRTPRRGGINQRHGKKRRRWDRQLGPEYLCEGAHIIHWWS